MGAIRKVADLSEQDRRALEFWLEERAPNWTDASLDNAINELRSMPECPWRFVAAVHLIRLDLKRQWQAGRKVTLDQYLEAYPELGGKDGVAAELIVAEMKAKSKAGMAIDVERYLQTYPNQAAELRSLLAEASSAAAGSTRKMRAQTPSGPRPEVGLSAASPPAHATAAPMTAKSVPTPRPSAESPPPAKPAEPQSVLPEMFGRYRIEKQLGQGGMGSVYKAYDTDLHRHVALKVPQFGPEEGAEVLERFKQEARAAATLRHTNLCQVYDVGAIDGTNFLTMEFIQGQSLEGYAARQQQGVTPRFIALVMTKLARALKTAHAKNVIHRDLKPSNIMLREADGTLEPVIVDFGLARRIDPGTQRLTQAGLVIGTWQYMTPEQLCGEPDALGPGCDIYALGVIMYELLTGRLPYDAPGQVVRGNAAAPSTLRADIDPRLEAICLKAMAATSAERYASMGDLATALTDFLRSATDKSPEVKAAIAPSGPLSKQRKPEDSSGLAAPDTRSGGTIAKLVAGGLAAGVAFLGVAVGLRSWMSHGSGTAAAPVAESPAPSTKPGNVVASPAANGNNPERLFDDARLAIREGKFAAAKATLFSYLGIPASSKQDEARALLAELDHALTRDEAKVRAKALVDDELNKYVDSGVNDLLNGIQNSELKDACKAILLEAFREEKAARSSKPREGYVASNTRPPGAMKRPARNSPSRAPGSSTVPVREPEMGFKLIYNGQNFDGWEGHIRVNNPQKKGIPRGTHYEECAALNVAHRTANTIVSNPVVGILSTVKLFQFTSLKFDYMIGPLGAGAPAKARVLSHAVAEFSLDKPLNLGNMNACSFIEVSILAAEAGEVRTRQSRNRDVATQPATTRAAHPNGQWNEMEIKCAERSIQVLVNGVEVNRLDTPRRINAKVAFSFGGIELHLANIRFH
jgi:serine/threonine protein kinase